MMVRRRRAEVEIELGDEDVIEVVASYPRSGTYPRTAPLLPPPELRSVAEPAPSPIRDAFDTSVDETIADLARLSNPTNLPRVRGPYDPDDLDPNLTWLLSLVHAQMTVGEITQTSPLSEEETLRLFTRLINLEVITLAPSRERSALPTTRIEPR